MQKIKLWLQKLSFRTGVIVLALCVPCYIMSFVWFSLDMSYTLKFTLWVIFFGLAKTFQYSGLAIIGVEGVKRLKKWWVNLRNKKVDPVP